MLNEEKLIENPYSHIVSFQIVIRIVTSNISCNKVSDVKSRCFIFLRFFGQCDLQETNAAIGFIKIDYLITRHCNPKFIYSSSVQHFGHSVGFIKLPEPAIQNVLLFVFRGRYCNHLSSDNFGGWELSTKASFDSWYLSSEMWMVLLEVDIGLCAGLTWQTQSPTKRRRCR